MKYNYNKLGNSARTKLTRTFFQENIGRAIAEIKNEEKQTEPPTKDTTNRIEIVEKYVELITKQNKTEKEAMDIIMKSGLVEANLSYFIKREIDIETYIKKTAESKYAQELARHYRKLKEDHDER